jgi:phenazine biosynthesis protein phzE
MQSALLGNTAETEDISDLLSDPEILAALQKRNKELSSFHFKDQSETNLIIPELQGKTATVIHNDDDFSYTLGRMMRQMGMEVEVVKNQEYVPENKDILVIGGGPGDINDLEDTRMNHLRTILAERGNTPVL